MGLNPQYSKAFPQASNWVWKRIKPVKPTLGGYGIQADQVDRGRGKAKRTVIVLDRTGGAGPVTGVVGTVKTNLLTPQIWLRNPEKLVVGSVGPVWPVKNRNRMIVGVRPKSRGNHHEPPAAPYGTRKTRPRWPR